MAFCKEKLFCVASVNDFNCGDLQVELLQLLHHAVADVIRNAGDLTCCRGCSTELSIAAIFCLQCIGPNSAPVIALLE